MTSDSTGSPLSAGTVDGVLNNMVDALFRLDGYVNSHERDIVKSLNSCHDKLTGPERATLLLPAAPRWVHEPDSRLHDDFMPP